MTSLERCSFWQTEQLLFQEMKGFGVGKRTEKPRGTEVLRSARKRLSFVATGTGGTGGLSVWSKRVFLTALLTSSYYW